MLLLALLAPPRCLLRFLAHWLLVLPGLLSHVSTYLSVFSWLPAGSLGLNPYPGKKFSCCFAVLRAVASVAIWGRFWRNLCERRLLPCRGFGARLAGSVWPRFDCTGRRRLREGSLLPDRSLCLGPFAFWAVLAAAFGSKGWGSRGHLRRRCWIEQKKNYLLRQSVYLLAGESSAPPLPLAGIAGELKWRSGGIALCSELGCTQGVR